MIDGGDCATAWSKIECQTISLLGKLQGQSADAVTHRTAIDTMIGGVHSAIIRSTTHFVCDPGPLRGARRSDLPPSCGRHDRWAAFSLCWLTVLIAPQGHSAAPDAVTYRTAVDAMIDGGNFAAAAILCGDAHDAGVFRHYTLPPQPEPEGSQHPCSLPLPGAHALHTWCG